MFPVYYNSNNRDYQYIFDYSTFYGKIITNRTELKMIKWNNLQELLKESKSKSKLSKATGISTGNISDWFNPDKKAQPSADALVKIAEYFGCSVDYLLDLTEDSATNIYSEKIIHLVDMGEIIYIDTHTQPVSAGKGSNICVDDQAIPRLYPATNISSKADYCVRISGDSMYPEYLNGDIVYVSEKEKPKHNDIGIFLYNGEAYCKRYYEKDEIKKLLSLNPDQERHKPIIIENDSFVTQGKVIGKFHSD